MTEHPSYERLELLSVPSRYRALVYLVGMVGFPVLVGVYVLVTLSLDLKKINESLMQLSTRIAERPMGLERTTDFSIYETEALRYDLQAGLPGLVRTMNFESQAASEEDITRTLAIIDRKVSGYIRPIVRKHQRFAARFPTVGGNLGSFFVLTAPSENLRPGEVEADLRGKNSKDVGESLVALITNNVAQFGDTSVTALMLPRPQNDLGFLSSLFSEEGTQTPSRETDTGSASPPAGTVRVIDPDLFLDLALDAVETVTVVLRDQMLQKVRGNSAELEQDS